MSQKHEPIDKRASHIIFQAVQQIPHIGANLLPRMPSIQTPALRNEMRIYSGQPGYWRKKEAAKRGERLLYSMIGELLAADGRVTSYPTFEFIQNTLTHPLFLSNISKVYQLLPKSDSGSDSGSDSNNSNNSDNKDNESDPTQAAANELLAFVQYLIYRGGWGKAQPWFLVMFCVFVSDVLEVALNMGPDYYAQIHHL